ncbi:hypothetical protein JHU38_12045 [Prevotella sp. A2931]|uniref:Uncharacterized protein n=1 Tax=Prevotella illustrans TaxID=2800387 RepID=A0ABS3M8I0_9BACT|nr:hypothetical protein [Prevotella illustrans]PTL25625.1 hypothetical protein C3V39_00155 [Prevotella sp. oral taxon 820]
MNLEFSNKGVKGCVSSAFSYMLRNKTEVLRQSYVAAIVSAIATGFYIYLLLPSESLHQIATAHPMVALGSFTFAILFSALSSIWYFSRLLGCVTGNYAIIFKRSLLSCLLITIVLQLVLLCGNMLLMGLWKIIDTHSVISQTAFEIVKLLFVLLYIIWLLPFCYSMMRYIHEKELPVGSIFRQLYVEGFKHKGFIALTLFVLILICSVVLVIVLMPGLILILEYLIHEKGLAMGDPNSLPHNFPFLLYPTLAVLFFIGQYVLGFCYYTMYFVYLSIKKRVDEKAKATIHRS